MATDPKVFDPADGIHAATALSAAIMTSAGWDKSEQRQVIERAIASLFAQPQAQEVLRVSFRALWEE